MRIALIGATGQLGTALTQALSDGGSSLVCCERFDIADAAQTAAALEAAGPDLVINAAAYNFVDKAEDEPDRAYAVNALGPRHIAQWCGARDAALVHVSTDYVFGSDSARQAPYHESDLPGPLGAYAVSKLAGEAFVQAHCPKHFVVRTCGLYGRAASLGKGNFVETMLRLGRERGAVSVVDDQWCTPTSAVDLAAAIARLIRTDRFGLYHATNSGAMTWRALAAEIFQMMGMNVEVRPITTAEYPTKARRPAYSVLDSSKLAATIGGPLRPWQEALADYLHRRGADGRA